MSASNECIKFILSQILLEIMKRLDKMEKQHDDLREENNKLKAGFELKLQKSKL